MSAQIDKPVTVQGLEASLTVCLGANSDAMNLFLQVAKKCKPCESL